MRIMRLFLTDKYLFKVNSQDIRALSMDDNLMPLLLIFGDVQFLNLENT